MLGMHRSGTSALAGLLAQCGFGAPEHLIPASNANERGFFESEQINAFNDAILADCGQNWLSLAPIAEDWWSGDDAARRQAQLDALVAGEFASTRMPVIKDPRICRLLPLWEQALDRQAKETRVALIIRSPAEVAQSLHRRNQLDIELGMLLWARYNLDAEYHSRNLRRRILSFEALLGDWRRSVEKLDLPISPDSIRSEQIDQFLSVPLRHNHGDLASTSRIGLVHELHEILSRWAADGERAEDYSDLARIRSNFDEMGLLLGDLTEKGRLERKRRTSLAAKAAATEAELESREQQFAGLVQSIERSFDNLEQRNQALQTHMQRLEEEFANIASLEKSLEQATTLAATQARELEAAAEDRRRIEQQLAEMSEGAVRSAAELAKARSGIEHFEREYQSAKKKYRSTQGLLEREQKAHQTTARRLKSQGARLAEIEISPGWRTERRIRHVCLRLRTVFTAPLSGKRKNREAIALLKSSAMFDPEWYLQSYPDVAVTGLDPYDHFLSHGWKESRNPSAAFSISRYLRANPDIAAAGVNPLLHYLEHGQFEGREALAGGAQARPSLPLTEKLDPAAPVYSSGSAEPEIAWRRAAHEALAGTALFDDFGAAIGVSSAEDAFAAIRQSLCTHPRDYGSIFKSGEEAQDQETDRFLEDAFFVNCNRLKVRLRPASAPVVVRMIQADSSLERIRLVGEGVIANAADSVDADLANPYFPVAIVRCSADGELIDWRVLRFPSLCRGGCHYFELVDLASGSDVDLLAVANGLWRQLCEAQEDRSGPLLREIEVEVAGNDGQGRLFQSHFRDWLDRLFGISIKASSLPDPDAGESFLARTATLSPASARQHGGSLILTGDMAPTISILCAPATSKGMSESPLPVVMISPEPEEPAFRYDLPTAKIVAARIAKRGEVSIFPRLKSGTPPTAVAGAIRFLTRSPSDVELLMPNSSGDALPDGEALSWLVASRHDRDQMLFDTLASVAVQAGSTPPRLALVGPVSTHLRERCDLLFSDRWRDFETVDEALQSDIGDVVASIVPGVVLHNVTTGSLLRQVLALRGVVSASCPLVAQAPGGKSRRTLIVDGGQIFIGEGAAQQLAPFARANLLWRSTFAVAAPPSGLFVARRDALATWHKGERHEKGIHLLTSLTTASLSVEEDVANIQPMVIPTPSASSRSVCERILVG
ncbi:hypothetical protein LZ496_00640 [Sphingomonas sp. NSE70-1]|uniref:Sulfotransferase family protein n=1 Tax=Sphingomonas caseinilyticus TaxID=2908205 RepID=A0ABT0RR52_9SPHN|nr:hypothetical protein [Sphingomonas caseinilyticus]MCL6697298.1 hypothetical protein [Sphingomonas caseinilyticus]